MATGKEKYIRGKNYTLTEKGKKVRRKYLGKTQAGADAWQGVSYPKMKTVKEAPRVNPKTKKVSKRKYGKKI